MPEVQNYSMPCPTGSGTLKLPPFRCGTGGTPGVDGCEGSALCDVRGLRIWSDAAPKTARPSTAVPDEVRENLGIVRQGLRYLVRYLES